MVYKKFAEEYMALPVLTGIKSESEKFAGAVKTYAIEGMMQDRRALQAGTSHNLGQNFARAFDVTFQTPTGDLEYVWATSWGVSTRLVGALIMAHSDDHGLILPPALAPTYITIIPIYKTDTRAAVLGYAEKIQKTLSKKYTVSLDADDQSSPGWKFAEAELQGIPIRIEVGPRDMEQEQVVVVRRDTGVKNSVAVSNIESTVENLHEDIQNTLFHRALTFRKDNTHEVEDYRILQEIFASTGGFVESGWCGSAACEAKIKEDTKATIRVLPLGRNEIGGKKCILCGEKAQALAVFGKAY